MSLKSFRTSALLAALVGSTVLSGCALPFLVVGGAMVGGTLIATDRRTTGTQLDDQGIELRAGKPIGEVLGNRGHVNVTSYNRLVLITGEVPTDADKAAVEAAVTKLDNVRSVVNELSAQTASSLTARSNDTLLTSKVKATLIDAGDISAHAFKVVTERNVVFLMGRVTDREATRAVDLVRTIKGVEKVVRVLEVITDAELAAIDPRAVPKAAGSTTSPAPAPTR